MKKVGLFVLVFLACYGAMHGQKIQYSRQVIRTSLADAMQLVANVSGNHHLLCFTAGKKPKLYLFNKLLQFTEEKEIDVKLKETCDVRILPFENYYYLYLYFPETATRNLLKIGGEGETEDLTGSMMKLMDSAGINRDATVQLVNQHNTLYFLSHTYFDTIKQVNTRILELGPQLGLHKADVAFFPFDWNIENLQQTMLANDRLLVLKTSKDNEKGNLLEVVKFDMNSGEVLLNTFNSGSHHYVNPAFRYHEKDSSLLLYALLREPMGSMRTQRTVFISQLNDSLQQQTPISLLKTQFRNNTGVNFLFLDGEQPCWLSFANTIRISREITRSNNFNYFSMDGNNPNLSRLDNRYLNSPINYNQPTAVRLSVLDEEQKATKDTLVENKGSFYDLQPFPFAQFTVNKAAYLVLIQNFSSNKRGLAMFHVDANGELKTTNLPVYDRYDYKLSLLQSTNDYFILPYTYKGDTGLLKITLSN